MTLDVHGVCYYRAQSDDWTDKWKDQDYAARNLVQAIKGGAFKGYTDVTINGTGYRIRNDVEGRRAAYNFASIGIANKMRQLGCTDVAIIPVPSSSHTAPCDMFTGKRLAESVKSRVAASEVRAELYFQNAMPKSAQGGGRNQNEILANLRVNDLNGITNAILLDDVYTSGAHIKAATRFLRNLGVEVEHAFVVGRTAWERPDDMFKVESETVYFI